MKKSFSNNIKARVEKRMSKATGRKWNSATKGPSKQSWKRSTAPSDRSWREPTAWSDGSRRRPIAWSDRSWRGPTAPSERSESRGWQNVSTWYNKVTNQGEGHYFHQHVVIPGVLRLLSLDSSLLSSNPKILDIGCGNGVLAKAIPEKVSYLGIDASQTLLRSAQSGDKNPNHKFILGDATKAITIPTDFTHAAMVLSLQNMNNAAGAISTVSRHLIPGGKLVIVLNHPMFRIPRQTAWGTDPTKKIQFRRVDKYLSPMAIPIRTNPSDRESQETISYHLPLSEYSKMLKNSKFVIELIEEWASDRESQEGRTSKMENRSRSEIPLFMTLVAIKK